MELNKKKFFHLLVLGSFAFSLSCDMISYHQMHKQNILLRGNYLLILIREKEK
jgi:hypothetical protein